MCFIFKAAQSEVPGHAAPLEVVRQVRKHLRCTDTQELTGVVACVKAQQHLYTLCS